MLRPRNTTLPVQLPDESLAAYARRIGVHPNTVTRWRKQGRLVVAKSEDMALAQPSLMQDPVTAAKLVGLIQERIVDAQIDYMAVRGKIDAATKSLADLEWSHSRKETIFRELDAASLVLDKEVAERQVIKRDLDTAIEGLHKQRTVIAQSIREVSLETIRKAMKDPDLKTQVLSEFAPAAPEPPSVGPAPSQAQIDPVEVLKARLGEIPLLKFQHLLQNVTEYREVYGLFLMGQAVEPALEELGSKWAWSREEFGFVCDVMREWKAAEVPSYVVDRRGRSGGIQGTKPIGANWSSTSGKASAKP